MMTFIRFNKKDKKMCSLIRDNRGFTLIELMTVVSIIAMLMSFLMIDLYAVRRDARVTKAQADLAILRKGLYMLEMDTDLSSGKISATSCVVGGTLVSLDSCVAGLQCTDGGFPGWNGPYVNIVLEDPWATYYYFDSNYQCTDQVGCESIASGTDVRAIVSFGPDKTEDYGPGSDDLVVVLCQ